ncbi:MAG: hypothetical protein PWP23_1233 [Candidatus Sumerlaeota bacterium]|nr:hypothetical protein [Candidatus Sumerlaeota bacterium]
MSPSGKKRSSRWHRWLVLAFLVPTVAYWGRANLQSLEEREAWRVQWERDDFEFLASQTLADVPADSEQLLTMAYFLGEQPIPPQYEGAQELIARALLLAPMKSKLWLYGARYRLFQGEPDQARAALEHSDVLHPFHTDRRLMAVELWDLLGERDRAVALAVQIGGTTASARKAAAQRLLWIGVPPSEAWGLLWREGLSPAETADLLEGLWYNDADAVAEVVSLIPEETYSDAEFRQRLARLLKSPVVLEAAWKVWQLESGSLEQVPGANTQPPLLAENLTLERSPLSDNFPFGWRPFTITPNAELYWLEGEGAGRLRLTFRASPVKSKEFRWLMYELPMPAHEHPVRVRIRLRAEGATESPCILIAKQGEAFHNSARKVPMAEEESVYEAVLAPTDAPVMLSLSLGRTHRDAPEAGDQVVYLEGIEFATAQGEVTQ